jgi:hypothetical protein
MFWNEAEFRLSSSLRHGVGRGELLESFWKQIGRIMVSSIGY